MSQKEQVLILLEKLIPYWELAEWMVALIDAGFMDKDTYQNLLFMLSWAIKNLEDPKLKKELQLQLTELKTSLQK